MKLTPLLVGSGAVLLGLFSVLPRSEAQQGAGCAFDNAGLELPRGFCAQVVAEDLAAARHLTVAANGDIFVATGPTRREQDAGGVVALRDTDGDGRADERVSFGSGTGDDVEFRGDYLYFSTHGTVVRYPWTSGSLEPAGPADTVVRDLPAVRSHQAKSIAFGPDNALYVNIGSPSNSCQVQDRSSGVPGKDPCEELETRAGIWRFDADRLGQTQSDGGRFATGLRNTVALTAHPGTGQLYGVIHGRDQLWANWPDYFTEEQSAEKPSEEFVLIEQDDDFGWPYCYHDPELGHKVLAPEYGGDGSVVGRCSAVKEPLIGFPAHWAPNGVLFYSGHQFPAKYHNGAFIAFHGSWNRSPLPQAGYNVVFVPFDGTDPDGSWEVFADGFAGAEVGPREAAHRPVGLAVGPDGSLYVSDDKSGTIFRIMYTGN
ncbi:MAG: PQQ-dependent sugar dehydrogenase [Gemmatimonadota bacterium]|nr:MAG: PQQ-dependent sugar dehydrogenase [Gemmatimonadota bacterium]